MSDKSFILIDGHALAYRYFFALERTGMKTSDNQPTWAVFGFFKALFDLLQNDSIKPDAIAVTFDVSRHTYRTEMFADYKANRESMPDTLRSQIALIVEGLNALNIPIYTKEGYEADDVIGTISTKAKQKHHKTYILTGDRDSFQLVDRDGYIKVIMPSKGELIEYDWYKVYEKMGVYPYQITDYKGLSGDTSDNIPGIKGIGEKTACKLLNRFDKLEQIYENIDNITEKALNKKLVEGKDVAVLSKELATIQKDLDINFDFDCAKLEMPDYDAVIEFFKKNQFYSFLKNSDNLLKPFKIASLSSVVTPDCKETVQVNQQGQMQLGLGIGNLLVNQSHKVYNHEKNIVDTEDKLVTLVEKLKEQTIFSIDVETTGINPLECDLVGISIAFSDQIQVKNNRVKIDSNKSDLVQSYYIPVFHLVGQQLDLEVIINYLAPILSDKNIAKTLQNAKFDWHVLKHHNMPLNNVIFDTMLASYIKDSSRKHGLKQQASDYLDYIMVEYDELLKNSSSSLTIETVPIEDAASYACDDAFATLLLTKYWQENLDEKELDLLYDIEVPLTIVLAVMEENGASIDVEYLSVIDKEINEKLSVIEEKIYNEVGEKFNINSPKQVGDMLFGKMNLKAKGMKSKTGFSTSAKVLETLAEEYQVARDILEQRHLAKLKSTYVDTLPELRSVKDGRIHTSFNQTITTTGRLSSSNPNLQNIPIRTELGNRIRGAFVAENKENLIISADYSQIELRLLAHISRDDNLIEAFCDDEDVHSATASKVFEVPIEQVTKEMRSKAKAVNFGIVYGQSRYGLASSLGITPYEAQDFIDRYFATYPDVKKYMDDTIKFAYAHGYVETLYGRKRYLSSGLLSTNGKIQEAAQRAAINAPIQGTAADVMKLAMVRLQNDFEKNNIKSKIIIQVHDELVIETVNTEIEEVKSLVKNAMELNQPFLVPLKVDIYAGKSWMEI
ncbi:TPA: DNA polymerase I [Candidatus Avigastranaerophilus faecigallinarum]|nr:DNA polymerase I [Candidatus Avigastranaerophilus faecigallinarum]